jgi:peptidoglycan hydrolase-like protein with peptidoglycan-binding domain
MPLAAAHWRTDNRLQAASKNAPPMKMGEPNRDAVRRLQEALIRNGFPIPSGPTGNYLQETASAVRAVEERYRLDKDEGVAGRQVLSLLDAFLVIMESLPPPPPPPPPDPVSAPTVGAPLALLTVPLARAKVYSAIAALLRMEPVTDFVPQGAPTFTFKDPVTVDALDVHFKLLVSFSPVVASNKKIMTYQDISTILQNFQAISKTIENPAMHTSGTPRADLPWVPAAAPLGGPIVYGPMFKNFDTPGAGKIGPNSRAAIIIHEATHVIDGQSGNDKTTHISEFDPRYTTQPVQFALHNPSSYASFAAHIFKREDPNPRYGLGAGRAL